MLPARGCVLLAKHALLLGVARATALPKPPEPPHELRIVRQSGGRIEEASQQLVVASGGQSEILPNRLVL